MMRQRTMTVVGIYDLGMAEAEKGMVFITLPKRNVSIICATRPPK